jgi:predicted Zn-ribbon and HTH transcriptional regulator
MNKEELLSQPMIVCKSCGWEIMRSAISFDPICDDCAMDSQIQYNYEQEITL